MEPPGAARPGARPMAERVHLPIASSEEDGTTDDLGVRQDVRDDDGLTPWDGKPRRFDPQSLAGELEELMPRAQSRPARHVAPGPRWQGAAE